MPFDIDFAERADLKFHIKKFFLRPENWFDPASQLSFPLVWQSQKFLEVNQASIPALKGVYAFTVNPGYSGLCETRYLFYIGKTNRDLQTRFGEYVDEGNGKGKPRIKVFEMLKQYAGHLYFNYATIANSDQVDEAEDKLINTFVPNVNVAIEIAKIKPEYRYIYE